MDIEELSKIHRDKEDDEMIDNHLKKNIRNVV